MCTRLKWIIEIKCRAEFYIISLVDLNECRSEFEHRANCKKDTRDGSSEL